MNYSPDWAAAEAERLMAEPSTSLARKEAAIQMAAREAERIIEAVGGYAVDRPWRRREDASTFSNSDVEKAQAEAAAKALGGALVRRLEKADRGREYKHPGYGDEVL